MKSCDHNLEGPSAQKLAEEQELQATYPGYRDVDADYAHAGKKALERWQDWKFGMRIIWGVYSILGLDASDWGSRAESEEFKKTYKTLYQVFNPTDFDADEWTELAERAGMKYFVFTAKHGDGFCMYDTKRKVKALRRKPRSASPPLKGLPDQYEEVYISYSVMDSPFKKDIVAELVKAFRKRGMGIGIYPSAIYPHYLDVNDPGYDQAIELITLELRELCTNYGKIDLFAFDGDRRDEVPRPELIKMTKMVRWLQPEALFRHRGLGPYGDYQIPEHWVPGSGDDPRLQKPWQAIEQMGLRWAYQPNDTYKSKEWILETLIDCVAKGGNFMLGVSPMANGKFPEETAEYLLWVGAWLKVNGEAIYATRPYKFYMQGDDICFTRSKDNKNVYAISLKWPGKTLSLKNVRAKEGAKIHMLGVKDPLNWRNDPTEGLVIEIPDYLQDGDNRPCKHAYVFKIEGFAPLEISSKSVK